MKANLTAESRCSDCGDRMDEGAGLALGDGLYCEGKCSFFAAVNYYYAADGVVPGKDALPLAGTFARLAASLYRGSAQASKGNLIALSAVQREAFAAESAIGAAAWEAILGVEEAAGRADSHRAQFARASAAKDIPAMTAAAKALEERRALDVVIARRSLSPVSLAIAGACATAAGTCLCGGQRGRVADAPCSCPAGAAGRVDFVALTKSVMGVK